MRKIIILCQRFFDPQKGGYSIGGIQTYIYNILTVANKSNLKPIIVQYADKDYCECFEGVTIYGVDVRGIRRVTNRNKALKKKSLSLSQPGDLFLFATEELAFPTPNNKSIAIQHGVSWDIPTQKNPSKLSNIKYSLVQAIKSYLRIRYVSYTNVTVCVDYNYLNWYRTQVSHRDVCCVVIPNFSKTTQNNERLNHDGINIIFARRLQWYRGTRIFAEAIKSIVEKFYTVHVTIAGEGPDEDFLHKELDNYSNVSFIKYTSDESLEIHKDKDIAVVPTIGSEGTSLSLLEAMAAGCATICTNVGGMTNIVIDQYNGLMVSPEASSLYEALVDLITDENKRKQIANNAKKIVEKAFSYDLWEKRWIEIINKLLNNEI